MAGKLTINIYFNKGEVQIDNDIDITEGIDLTLFDPVVYSGHYHSIGKHLGKIGDFINED